MINCLIVTADSSGTRGSGLDPPPQTQNAPSGLRRSVLMIVLARQTEVREVRPSFQDLLAQELAPSLPPALTC